MDDYYRRAFGPAAAELKIVLEAAGEALAWSSSPQEPSRQRAYDLPEEIHS